MDEYQAERLVEAIEGFVRQIIRAHQPQHQMSPKDDQDYRQEIIDILVETS